MRDRLIQFVLLCVAAGALTGAAALRRPIERQRDALRLMTVTSDPGVERDPKAALLQLVPGGLRAPILTYLWIRSQDLKDKQRFYDAQQLRDLICDMMPHFAGVYAYHGWDMAWNISVSTYTPEERWMWVHNGLKLIRDKGLYYNPDDLYLYRELSWIFFNKMGQYIDEMHMVYKRRWAALMQHLLGSPPLTGSTRDVIDAFRPIVEAPDDQRVLRSDPQTAKFLDALRAAGVEPDDAFLTYYNRFSDDPRVSEFEWMREKPRDQRERRIARLMTDPALAAPRAKVLAFVRRKILKQRYRMDPKWMLHLMETYGPLDWRSVNAHGIYWATLGLHKVKNLKLQSINELNTGRNVLNALKSLTAGGQIYYTPNPDDPEMPFIDWGPDWRFIEPTHQEYLRLGTLSAGGRDKIATDQNALRNGHINYLTHAIQQLYIGGRRELAQHYYDEMKRLLKPTEDIYKLDLHAFVREKIREIGTPTYEAARKMWFAALRTAYRALAGGNQAQFSAYRSFAQRTYREWCDEIASKAPRMQPPPFETLEQEFIRDLFLRPEVTGLRIPLLVKVRLYRGLPLKTRQAIYPRIAPTLRTQCQQERIDFDKAFPAPPPQAGTPGGGGSETPRR